MALRFEDHASFQRACLLAAAGSALAAWLVAWTAPTPDLLAWGTAGAMAALVPLRRGEHGWQTAIVAISAGGGVALALLGHGGAPAAVVFALGAALRWEDELPPVACIAAACALATGAGWAMASIPALTQVFTAMMPIPVAAALGGGVLGLWLGGACAPLHLRAGKDRIEMRLADLGPRLEPELLQLARRAAEARQAALRITPPALRPELRRLLDGLAIAALDLAEQGSEISRGASAELERDLSARREELARAAGGAADGATRDSYRRAGAAVEAQLEHMEGARRRLDSIRAGLHEHVAQLERARSALAVPGSAAGERAPGSHVS